MRLCDSLVPLFVAFAACKSRSETRPISVESRAAAIDSQVPTMRHDTATVLGLTAEGAWFDAAYDGTKLRRLRAELLGETGRATETFYFDSAAFYVVRGEVRYDAPLSGRVADSILRTYDLTRPGVLRSEVDSLNAVARELLRHLRESHEH